MKELFREGLSFSICGIVASDVTQLRREWDCWIRIKNANPGEYKYVMNGQYLKDLFRAELL